MLVPSPITCNKIVGGGSYNFLWMQVYPMYKAFIEPDLQTAHIRIINKFNPFTGFQNPTYILKV